MDRSRQITPEEPRTSTARRATLFAVGIVLCFVALNAGARWYLANHGTNLGYRIVHAKWQLLDSMDAPVDWLVFGDSSGCHGIVPEVLAEELGGSAVNLATLANLLVADDAWMLQRYIERFGPPKNVVLVHAFDVWHRGYNSALIGQIPQPWGFWKRVQPTIEFTPEQERRVFLSRFVPLYAENGTLREHLAHFGPPKEIPFSITETGFVPGRPHGPQRFARDMGRARKFLRENKTFRVSGLNERAMKTIGDLSKAHGFPVYLVNGPMHAGIAARPDFKRYQEQKTTRLSQMTRAWPDFHAIGDLQTYATRQMEVYVDHVIPEMAPDYTRKVAASIRRVRGEAPPPRAVEAPERPNWPPPVAARYAEGEQQVELVFGGDLSLARGIASTIRKDGGVERTLAPLRDTLVSADLALANLECVVSHSDEEPASKRWRIRAEPAMASGLTETGLDVVSLANNHTLDFGRQGFFRTWGAVAGAGLHPVGAAWDDGRSVPLVVQVGAYTVGVLAYNDTQKYRGAGPGFWPKPAQFDVERIIADIERLDPHVDVVVLSLHWGFEYSLLESADQRRSGRRFIDAGADLVIGHGTHTPQPVERYRDGLIAYSLGDLLFDKGTPFKRVRCGRRFLLSLDWGPDGLGDHRLIPVEADSRFRPIPTADLDTASFEYRPRRAIFRFSDALDDLDVARVTADAVAACDRRSAEPPRRPRGYLKWLRDRRVCPGDAERPWLTVARTAERANGVRRVGLWAHPHPGGPLRITAPAVPLGRTLSGFAGVPDWPATQAKGEAAPIEVRVSIDGRPPVRVSVPFRAQWQPLRIDTAADAGRTVPVVVEIEGGPRAETGFVFDLLVDPEPAFDDATPSKAATDGDGP